MKKLIFTLVLAIFSVATMFPQITEEVMFWENSTNLEAAFLDPGWVSVWNTADVTLETLNGNRLPLVTSPAISGNAIKIAWKQTDSGFDARIIEPYWTIYDITNRTYLKLHVYPTAVIPIGELFSAYLETNATTQSGKEIVSIKVPIIADFIQGGVLVPNQWNVIYVPISAMTNSANEHGYTYTADDKTKIEKVGLMFNNSTNGVTHTIYLDNISFVTGTLTSVEKTKVEEINVSYLNGEIHLMNTIKNVSIFDISGKQIANNLQVNEGIATIQLAKGVYIVKTDLGTAKLMVK